MLTPQQIQDLADPIESVYIHMVDELLVNIGKHITSPTWTHTASWEVQKLSELGQLTKENAAIINKWIKSIPQEMRDTMEDTRKAALDRLEKQLEAAMLAGDLPKPTADSTARVFQDYFAQAADRMNLVNTTMLQSSLDQYVRALSLTAEIEARMAIAQRLLNEAAGNVATGAETRTAALKRALRQISAEGLTGFVDRAGHRWSPEAYVNMDIRTTVHNTAIQATRARMQDYGTDVFQVSSHAGARPGCYPYQGKFYSWSNRYGEVELGDGRMVSFAPLNTTTHGQPAGLFGINCGHYPIPIIPGVTIPHGADAIQSPEENAKAYAESQEQRALERKIREAKRDVEMLGPLATKEDRAKVRDAQKQMRDFIERTGRTRRYDREQIGGSGKNSDLQKKDNGVTIEERRKAWDRQFFLKYGSTSEEDRLPEYRAAYGISEKLYVYSLNPEHPTGKNKAVVFKSALGYTQDNVATLEAQIRLGLEAFRVIPKGHSAYGTKYDVIMLAGDPNGVMQPIVTGWIIPEGETAPRMVTAYVHNKLHRP